jgi:tetratricopeptide (TPR) repeat protein
MALALVVTGDFDGAIAAGQEALELAAALGDRALQGQASRRLGEAYSASGAHGRAAELLRWSVEAADREAGTSSIASRIDARTALVLTLSEQGRFAEGRALLEEGIRVGIRIGGVGNHARWVAWLSEVCRLMGHGEEAWQPARQALDLARQLKNRGDEALALHQLGAVYAHANPPDAAQAEAHYQQALALAEALGMRPLQAHGHHGLGRLYGQTGQREQARAELSAAIELYRAMEMTFWLPQAEAALAEAK